MFHPQENGQVERFYQNLEITLLAFCTKNPDTWSSQLLWAEYSHNALVNSTGYSPVQAAYGCQTQLLRNQEKQTIVASHRRIATTEYKVGDRVCLSSIDVPLKGDPKSCPITNVINRVSLKLDIPSTPRICPVIHISERQ